MTYVASAMHGEETLAGHRWGALLVQGCRMSVLPKAVEQVVFCEVDDGAVLLHAAQEVYYGLNSVGAQIWHLLPPASTTLDALVRALQERYPDVPAATLSDDVMALLADLAEHGLVEPSS